MPLRRLFIAASLAATVMLVACDPPKVGGAGGGGGGGGSGSAGRAGGGAGAGGGSGSAGAGAGPGGGGAAGAPRDPGIAPFPDGGAMGGQGGAPPANPGIGEGPACAAEAHQSKILPVDLLFLVDISGSMEETSGMTSKWGAVREALTAFTRDPRSAGLGMGLTVFPIPAKSCTRDADCGALAIPGACEIKGICGTPAQATTAKAVCNSVTEMVCPATLEPCTPFGFCSRSGLRCANVGMACPGGMAGDQCAARPRICPTDTVATCNVASYVPPVVPIADLPGVEPAMARSLAALSPQKGTPTTPAVRGALDHLRARATAMPNRRPILVLATDGRPETCVGNTVEAVTMALAAAATGTPAIPTYVIGVFMASELAAVRPVLDGWATAGATGMPFVLETGNDLTQRFIDAINQVRGSALACEFAIPRPTGNQMLDFGKVNVRARTPAGDEDLPYVETAARCDPTRGGWYYDVVPAMGTPTRVRLCPTSCNKVKMTTNASIELRFGCKTVVID
jgi:hypothetical protein